jgi:hypothetical protein
MIMDGGKWLASNMDYAERKSWFAAVAWGCTTAIVTVLLTEGALFLNGESSERRNYISSGLAGSLVAFLIRFDYLIPHAWWLALVASLVLVGAAAYLRYRSQ